MKVILFFISVVLSRSVIAVVQVNDPSNLLNTVDTYINAPSFDVAFVVSDQSSRGDKDCTFTKINDFLYSHECSEERIYSRSVSETTSDYVVLNYSNQAENEKFTRADYAQINGNYLRQHIKQFDLLTNVKSITIDIEQVEFETVDLQGSTIQAIRTHFTSKICREVVSDLPPTGGAPLPPMEVNSEECFTQGQEILLGRNIPYVVQPLEHVPNRLTSEKVVSARAISFSRL